MFEKEEGCEVTFVRQVGSVGGGAGGGGWGVWRAWGEGGAEWRWGPNGRADLSVGIKSHAPDQSPCSRRDAYVNYATAQWLPSEDKLCCILIVKAGLFFYTLFHCAMFGQFMKRGGSTQTVFPSLAASERCRCPSCKQLSRGESWCVCVERGRGLKWKCKWLWLCDRAWRED